MVVVPIRTAVKFRIMRLGLLSVKQLQTADDSFKPCLEAIPLYKIIALSILFFVVIMSLVAIQRFVFSFV